MNSAKEYYKNQAVAHRGHRSTLINKSKKWLTIIPLCIALLRSYRKNVVSIQRMQGRCRMIKDIQKETGRNIPKMAHGSMYYLFRGWKMKNSGLVICGLDHLNTKCSDEGFWFYSVSSSVPRKNKLNILDLGWRKKEIDIWRCIVKGFSTLSFKSKEICSLNLLCILIKINTNSNRTVFLCSTTGTKKNKTNKNATNIFPESGKNCH